jgi:large subunit ribosomal protein L4
MAVLSKLQDKEAFVIDDLQLSEVKTKSVAAALKAIQKTLNLPRTTILVGTAGLQETAEADRNLYLSARNIEGVKVLPVREFNTYILLRQKRLVLTRSALDELRKGSPKTETAVTSPAQ